jgi:hypothetical protein
VAEFCQQCADDLDLPTGNFDIGEQDAVQTVLCEGCGPTNVDGRGICIYDCQRHHATEMEVFTNYKRAIRNMRDQVPPTPDSSLPPFEPDPAKRRTMLIEIEVSADFEKRLDNQWEVEREINADRWKWRWASEAPSAEVVAEHIIAMYEGLNSTSIGRSILDWNPPQKPADKAGKP